MKSFYRRTRSGVRNLRIEQLEARLPLDASALVISEFMASNDNTLLDAEGDSSDWVEIFNSGSSTVDLTGIHLTDDAGQLDRWQFQSGTTLAPGSFLVVFASGKDTVFNSTEQHTDFKLSAGGEYLALVDVDASTIIDEYAPEFPTQMEDLSYGYEMEAFQDEFFLLSEGDQARGLIPTNNNLGLSWTEPDFSDASWPISGDTGFGYENNPGNTINYVDEIETSVSSGTTNLYLRVPFTLNSFEDLGALTLRMKYDDGFVAYINGHQFASANAPDTLSYNTPAAGLQPDSLAEVFEEFDASSAIPHLRLGQNVLAIHSLNLPNSSDMLAVPELYATPSVLKSPEQIGFFTQPTPGYGNVGEAIAGFTETPTFSLPHGFYDSSQTVSLATTTPNAIIVYTTDGSTPSVDSNFNVTNGLTYQIPLTISSTSTLRATAFRTDYEPSRLATSTYLFVDDIINQSPQGQIPGPGWGFNGLNDKFLNYGMDPEIINLYGEQAVKDSLKSLTTFSITTDIGNLFDANDGIYVNATNRGRDWERPASIELIDSEGGFQVNAGIRIRGGFSRNDFNPKHAFRFYFRGEYGATKLEYPLFGDEGTDRFDVLDLRTAQNHSWSSGGSFENTFVREVFGRDVQREIGQPYTRSRYHHLYLNGEYWGIFQTQERVEAFFAESYLGGDEGDYDRVKSDLAISGGTEIADGNDLAWRELFDLAQDLADNPTANANNYWTMQGLNPDGTRNLSLPILLDVDNLADYMLTIFYTGAFDTGISQFLADEKANNWFGIRNRVTNDHGFQFFIHDNEHSLGANFSNNIDRTGPFTSSNDRLFSQFNPGFLHQDLLASPEYRLAFADRVRLHMFDGGVMTPAASQALILARAEQVEPGIIAESARWGDSVRNTPRNKTHWQNEINSITGSYFGSRNSLVLSQLQGDLLYPTIAAPSYNQYGGTIPSGFALQISATQGTIYYTLDGSDPRAIGGGINFGSAQVYNSPITPGNGQTIQARSLFNGQWSALTSATFIEDLPGDFDVNGIVDQADLDLWKVDYGTLNGAVADADQDGDADGFDFLTWQQNSQPASQQFQAATSPPVQQAQVHATERTRLELIDAAIEHNQIRHELAKSETNALIGRPLSEPAVSESHVKFAIVPASANDNAQEENAVFNQVDLPEQVWLTDELLERVFG